MLTYFDFDPRTDGYHNDNYDDDDEYAYNFYTPMMMEERDWRRHRELDYLRRQQQQRHALMQREQELRRAYQEQQLKRRQQPRHGLHPFNPYKPAVVREEDPGPRASYRVMQSPNGHLYRIPVGREQPVTRPLRQHERKYVVMRGPDGRLFRVPVEDEVVDNHHNESMMHQRNDSAIVDLEPDVERRTTTNAKPFNNAVHDLPSKTEEETVKDDKMAQKPPKKRRSKVTVIVEDASDSEYENDEMNSVWRNRRPSPGQWMEPIDY